MAPTPQASGHEAFKKPPRQARHQVLVARARLEWPAVGREEQPLTGDLTLAAIKQATHRDLGVRFVATHGRSSFPACCRIAEPSSGWTPSTARLSFQALLRRERHVLDDPVIERAEKIQEHAPKRADSQQHTHCPGTKSHDLLDRLLQGTDCCRQLVQGS